MLTEFGVNKITVRENNAPLLLIRIRKRLPDWTTESYVLTGASAIEFYGKASPDDDDTDALFKYTLGAEITIEDDGSAVDASYSVISVQVAAADTAVPDNYYFHLDVVKNGRRETVMADLFEVENV